LGIVTSMRPLTLLRAATVGVTALTACSSSGSSAAKKDVTITACTSSPTGGHPTATGKIVNHSSKPSLYTIHVKFTDSAGNGVGDGVAAVAKVDPGTTANWHANGTLNAKGPLTCKLSSVTRNAVPTA
jgi:P pilus assembly chaperone PapD